MSLSIEDKLESIKPEVLEDLQFAKKSRYKLIREIVDQGISEERAEHFIDTLLKDLHPDVPAADIQKQAYEERYKARIKEEHLARIKSGMIMATLAIVFAVIIAVTSLPVFLYAITLLIFVFGLRGFLIGLRWKLSEE